MKFPFEMFQFQGALVHFQGFSLYVCFLAACLQEAPSQTGLGSLTGNVTQVADTWWSCGQGAQNLPEKRWSYLGDHPRTDVSC